VAPGGIYNPGGGHDRGKIRRFQNKLVLMLRLVIDTIARESELIYYDDRSLGVRTEAPLFHVRKAIGNQDTMSGNGCGLNNFTFVIQLRLHDHNTANSGDCSRVGYLKSSKSRTSMSLSATMTSTSLWGQQRGWSPLPRASKQ
jgi:hypothetical protein